MAPTDSYGPQASIHMTGKSIRESFDPNWMSARKMIEYYLDYVLPPLANPAKQLYEAVIAGEVRAHRNGVVLGPEWLKQLGSLAEISNPYALPPDIGLSLEDARRKWNFTK